MTFLRPLHHENGEEEKRPFNEDDYLDYLAIRREAIIKELRTIDDILIKNGRMKIGTLDRRVR